jgi:hypothetical protein
MSDACSTYRNPCRWRCQELPWQSPCHGRSFEPWWLWNVKRVALFITQRGKQHRAPLATRATRYVYTKKVPRMAVDWKKVIVVIRQFVTDPSVRNPSSELVHFHFALSRAELRQFGIQHCRWHERLVLLIVLGFRLNLICIDSIYVTVLVHAVHEIGGPRPATSPWFWISCSTVRM